MKRWPRGKYNGQRIEGFSVKLTVDVLHWRLACRWNFGEPCLVIGPFCLRGCAEYEWARRP